MRTPRWAIVFKDRIHQLDAVKPGIDIPGFVIIDVAAVAGVAEGWLVDAEGNVSPPPASPPLVRVAFGAALLSAMTDAQAKAWQAAVDAGTPAVRTYWTGSYRTPLPENSPKLMRLAKAASVDLTALFTAALAG